MPRFNMNQNTKVKDFKKTFSRLLSYLKKYRVQLVIILLFATASTIFTIIGPKILGKATTEIFNGLIGKIVGTSTGIDFNKVQGILLSLLGLYLVSMIFNFIQALFTTSVGQNIAFTLRNEISEKLHKLPLKYYESNQTGDILSRVTNDVDTISQCLDQNISQLFTNVITMIGILIMMFSINIYMALLVLLIVPFSLIIVGKTASRSQKFFSRQQKYLGQVNAHIEQIYSGNEIVKVYNGSFEAIDEFDKMNNKLYANGWKSQFLAGIMQPIIVFIGNISYVVVVIFGGYFVIKKQLEVGDILSFTQYARNFTNPFATIAQSINMIQAMIAASERVFEFLDEEEEISDKDNISDITVTGNIDFNDVCFGYSKEKIIINNFNAHIKAGSKIAIVGPTGAGKTTIVKLLMRFYDVDEGNILLDNINIKDIKRDSLRSNFGMVLQDTWLYSDTICENIRYGNIKASNKEVLLAASSVHIDHFIKTLPKGYEMVINEEANNLSAGQKQLLTIARVILKDPKILILDEATSSVDTRMESLINKAMDKLMENRTSFIIAHRLSTIRSADLILVMDHGDIVEQGTHDELLTKKGLYADIYNSQFETLDV